MEKMNADLTAAKVAAEAADKAKSSFLATVSHEIRWVHHSP
jgi:signal transduction histidine kinase